MIRFILICLVLINTLNARENPFFPSKNETDISFSTNKRTAAEPLKRFTMSLPSTARTIQSVTVTYKNLDGSIVSKKEMLGNSVDWHLPIFISQNIGGSEKKAKPTTTTQQSEKFTKLASLSFISLHANTKRLKIITKDKMIRNFLLTKPHRIVCDFARDISIRSYEKNIANKTPVTQIRFGNHKGYYRVVIELDGHYRYKVEDTNGAYYLNLL